jgi:hypothetical protein
MKPSFKFNFIAWGFLLGLFFAIFLEIGVFEIWQPLGKPPEEISRIIGSSGAIVYVQTKSGTTYKYVFVSDSPLWEVETSHDYRLYPKNSDSGYFITIPPLFWIKESYSIDDYGMVESGGIRRFAIAPDNSVWMWRHFSAGMAIIVLPIFPIAGLILGTLVAFIWFIVQLVIGYIPKRVNIPKKRIIFHEN